MENKTAFFSKKGLGFYLSLAAVLCAAVSFLAYRAAAGDMYGYDARVGYLFLAAIAVGVVFACKNFFQAGSILSGILYCAAFGLLLNVRFVYFATVVTGIAQQGVSTPMTLSTVFILAAIVLNLASGFAKNKR